MVPHIDYRRRLENTRLYNQLDYYEIWINIIFIVCWYMYTVSVPWQSFILYIMNMFMNMSVKMFWMQHHGLARSKSINYDDYEDVLSIRHVYRGMGHGPMGQNPDTLVNIKIDGKSW
jgi:hypothetical protein